MSVLVGLGLWLLAAALVGRVVGGCARAQAGRG